MTTFERGFADAERAATSVTEASKAVDRAAKQMLKAAKEGDIAKLRKASEGLASALEVARQDVANARNAWPFSPDEETYYLRDGYEAELLEEAKAKGLQIHRQDERLVAFPSVIQIIPGDRAVNIDRKKISTMRPSWLVSFLKANQTKKARFASNRFLEALYSAYKLHIGGRDGMGKVVSLSGIYETFTLLPGANSDYGRSDFGRDLFLLDRSGLRETRSGASFSLPASTGTRGGKGLFSFVAPDGERVSYYGIRFIENRP